MKPLLWLFVSLTIYFMFLVFRFAIKRIHLLVCLRNFASKHKFNFKLGGFSYFLPTNKSNNSFLTIETLHAIYHIKMFGVMRKHCEIHLWNTDQYSVRKFFFKMEFLHSSPLGSSHSFKRHMSKVTFKPPINNAKHKPIISILLFFPTLRLMRITYTVQNTINTISPGDKFEGVILADKQYLLWYILNREK